jgi:hypothetical protein
MEKQREFFFICQFGWRQIILPDGKVINLTSCDEGVAITVEGDLDTLMSVADRMNEFKGCLVTEINCDSNEIIVSASVFTGATVLVHHSRYGAKYPAIIVGTEEHDVQG